MSAAQNDFAQRWQGQCEQGGAHLTGSQHFQQCCQRRCPVHPWTGQDRCCPALPGPELSVELAAGWRAMTWPVYGTSLLQGHSPVSLCLPDGLSHCWQPQVG